MQATAKREKKEKNKMSDTRHKNKKRREKNLADKKPQTIREEK